MTGCLNLTKVREAGEELVQGGTVEAGVMGCTTLDRLVKGVGVGERGELRCSTMSSLVQAEFDREEISVIVKEDTGC